MEKVKYVTYKVLIAKERATSVFDDMITIPENKPYSEIPEFISAYVRTQLENIMLTEEERAEIHNDKKTYEQGLADAWEVARKLICEYQSRQTREILQNTEISCASDVFNNHTPAEAIAKIKAFEEEQKEIKVGDEVFMNFNPGTGIVTRIVSDGRMHIIWNDGFSGTYNIADCKKTGRHFPQVEELLKAMKERNRDEMD
jgi:hypothetical protein